MSTKISGKPRGRPRAFDVEEALARAQALFHAHGYDAVGVAALAEALGINPPSFYAAFGSKAQLFDRVLARYARSALPLDDILRPGRDLAEALADLLETAARIYSADPAATGCLVLEAARMPGDAECVVAARRYRHATHDAVHAFVAARRPDAAEAVADLIDITLSGLSAGAREGWTTDRLVATARTAARAVEAVLAQ